MSFIFLVEVINTSTELTAQTVQLEENNDPVEQIECESNDYTCELCLKTFRRSCHLRSHSCPFRDESISETMNINKNSDGISKSKRYSCDVCSKSFTRSIHLNNHYCPLQDAIDGIEAIKSVEGVNVIEKKKPKKMFKKNNINNCKICSNVFDNSKELRKHLALVHKKDNVFTCDICQMMFKNENIFMLHRKNHKKTQNDKEHDSVLIILNNSDENKIIESNSEPAIIDSNEIVGSEKETNISNKNAIESVFCCNVCRKTFRNKQILNKHKGMHDDSKLRCKICSKFLSKPSKVRQHIKKIHMNGDTYQCDKCHKNFQAAYQLTEHLAVHSEKRPYLCEMCHGTFKTMRYLKRHHRRNHQSPINNKTLTCGMCKKTFKTTKHLNCHKSVAHKQTDDNQYFCHVCDKGFKYQNNLAEHLEIHGFKNKYNVSYICKLCQVNCSSKDEFIKHLKTHKEIKSLAES